MASQTESDFQRKTGLDDQRGVEPQTEILAETENYMAWRADEPDETTFHLDINNVTLHFFQEEWNEFLKLVKELK
jgi:hypothetical protein